MYDRSRPPAGPRRYRGRPQGRRGGGSGQSLESNGLGVKVRGNPRQVADRYRGLARDAISSGDRIRAESFLQHAEHYQRLQTALSSSAPTRPHQSQDHANGRDEERSDASVTVSESDFPPLE